MYRPHLNNLATDFETLACYAIYMRSMPNSTEYDAEVASAIDNLLSQVNGYKAQAQRCIFSDKELDTLLRLIGATSATIERGALYEKILLILSARQKSRST